MSKRLKAPAGTDEANYGAERFRVDNNGTVIVPDEAVESLTHVGGFAPEPEPVLVPAGMVRMQHEDSGASCSVLGKSYAPDENGIVVVPLAAAADLLAHGFSHAPVLNPIAVADA